MSRTVPSEILHRIRRMKRDELITLARKLGLKGYAHLTKPELREKIISESDPRALCEHVFPTWRDKYYKHVYGLASVIGVMLATAVPLLPTDKLREIEKTTNELQTEVNSLQDLAVIIDGELALSSSEIARLVSTLRKLLEAIDAEVLSKVDSLRFRLAEATVANAERRFGDTIKTVTEEDVEKIRETMEAQIDLVIRAEQVRGDAFYGLRKWKQALTYYERILALRPNGWHTRSAVANCLMRLGQLPDALKHHTAVVAHYTQLVQQQGRNELTSDLARSLTGRGIVLYRLEKRDEALRDFDEAIGIYEEIDEERQTEVAIGLAAALNNRAPVLRDKGKLDRAAEDLRRAMDILKGLNQQRQLAELDIFRAGILRNLGGILFYQGKLDETILEYDKAIAILTRLIDEEERNEVKNDLAEVLHHRGLAYAEQGKYDEAIQDFNEAVAILTALVEQEGRTELAGSLNRVLKHRDMVLQDRQSKEGG